MKGVHAATNPLLAWTSPSQYWGAIRDSNSPSEFVKNMMLGNSGFLDEKTAEEYPWLNAALSVVGDGIGTKAAVGTAKNISRIYNNVKQSTIGSDIEKRALEVMFRSTGGVSNPL